ncbi:MAG: FKBP-type peptidyl-prolyl cis-trans isomerase [Crocinitomicaceae bacterium]
MIKYLSLLLVLLLFSCKTYNEDQLDDFDTTIQKYLKEKSIDCEASESGLYFKIEKQGEGLRIQAKDRISFTYKGSFLDGEVFDEQKEPVTFAVGELIGAWKEMVLKLNEGGEAFLIAPPQLGYGSRDLDDIPPNSILVYTLKVHTVE